MKASVEIASSAGVRLAPVETMVSLAWQRVVNGVGWFELVLPGEFDESLLLPDAQIIISVQPLGGVKGVDFVGMVRALSFETDDNGVDIITVAGPDANELFKRRIVAYYAGSPYSTKTDQSDDLLRALALENMGGSAVNTARNMSAAGLSFAGEQSAGASVLFACAWDELDGAIDDLVKAAAGGGTPIYWEIKPEADGSFKLYTYTGQPGLDRTSGNEVVFGMEWGNLSQPKLVLDYTEEVTYVYAGGANEGADRIIVEVESTARSSRSPWGRREAFVNASGEASTAALTALANARLEAGRPRLRFSGYLMDTEQAVYGKDWGLGDRVNVSYRHKQYPVLIVATQGQVDASGKNTIKAFCELADAIEGA